MERAGFMASQRAHDSFQAFLHFTGQLRHLRFPHECEHGIGVHELHVNRADAVLPHHDVAGQEQTDGGLAVRRS